MNLNLLNMVHQAEEQFSCLLEVWLSGKDVGL